MIKYSKAFIILKEDLESGLVIKKSFIIKGTRITEYWIYAIKKPKFWIPSNIFLQNRGNSCLAYIIICSSDYVQKERERSFLIEGLRLDGESVNEYLKQTNRHID